MVINTNVDALQAYRSSKIQNGIKTKSSEKLASGLKVNSAADDAAGMAISEKMRGQIRGLERAEQNVEEAKNLISAVEGAMSEVENMVHRIRELIVYAANETNTFDNYMGDRQKIQYEIEHLTKEIDDFAERFSYNTRSLLNGKYIDGNTKNEILYMIHDHMTAKLGSKGTMVDKECCVHELAWFIYSGAQAVQTNSNAAGPEGVLGSILANMNYVTTKTAIVYETCTDTISNTTWLSSVSTGNSVFTGTKDSIDSYSGDIIACTSYNYGVVPTTTTEYLATLGSTLYDSSSVAGTYSITYNTSQYSYTLRSSYYTASSRTGSNYSATYSYTGYTATTSSAHYSATFQSAQHCATLYCTYTVGVGNSYPAIGGLPGGYEDTATETCTWTCSSAGAFIDNTSRTSVSTRNSTYCTYPAVSNCSIAAGTNVVSTTSSQIECVTTSNQSITASVVSQINVPTSSSTTSAGVINNTSCTITEGRYTTCSSRAGFAPGAGVEGISCSVCGDTFVCNTPIAASTWIDSTTTSTTGQTNRVATVPSDSVSATACNIQLVYATSSGSPFPNTAPTSLTGQTAAQYCAATSASPHLGNNTLATTFIEHATSTCGTTGIESFDCTTGAYPATTETTCATICAMPPYTVGSTFSGDYTFVTTCATKTATILDGDYNITGLVPYTLTTKNGGIVTTTTSSVIASYYNTLCNDSIGYITMVKPSDISDAEALHFYIGLIDNYIYSLRIAQSQALSYDNAVLPEFDMGKLISNLEANKNAAVSIYYALELMEGMSLSYESIDELTEDKGLYFQTGANVLQGINFGVGLLNSKSLGIGFGDGKSAVDVNINWYHEISAHLQVLDYAVDYVNSERARSGVTINRLDHNKEQLTKTFENLVGADSRIRDTDMAKEMMKLTKADVMSQSSAAMLAQANSKPKTIMMLVYGQ